MSQSNQGRNSRGRGWRGRSGYYQRGKGGYWRGRGNYGGGWRGNFRCGRAATSSSRGRGTSLTQTSMYDVPSPFKGWKLYFPEEIYSDTSPVVLRVKTFEKFLQKAKLPLNEIETRCWFSVDFKELQADQDISEGIPDLAKEIRQSPETILQCIGLAMHQIISIDALKNSQQSQGIPSSSSVNENPLSTQISVTSSIAENPDHAVMTSSQPDFVLPMVHCRMVNFEPITPLKNLKANYYGKYVSVKGTVVRVSNIKPLCTQMVFECSTCNKNQIVKFPDGKFSPPTQCTAVECRSKSFTPKRSNTQTLTIDWQTIRIQEIMNDDQRESGRIPRTVDCELTNDLVDSCVPGDSITASGVVKVLSSAEDRHKKQKDKCMFLLYIHANSVTNTKGSKNTNEASSGVNVDFTMKDLYAIEEIQAQENLFRLIVASVCPSIYGHELVKAGLVLGIFGGTHKYVNDKNRIPVRGDPHILVVGDPGLGKSQMLQAMANIAPRSVYVCGNTTTTSGLTVTLSKEGGGSGDYALEAGALVLADQGCCCIDEFDKMGTQHQALLEAMEQQSISIAKAGIVCSLPARTSILAAANPVGGHYNKAKTVSENLRMGGALLSRFDLVFILLDKPDEELDALLSDHVMALHAGRRRNPGQTPSLNDSMLTQDELEAKRVWESQKPISERLKVPSGEMLDLIPAQLLRKYVAYARKYVHPRITADCAKILQQFYLDLRKQHQTKDSTPITTRQLESLIRLTEARARLELREDCTAQDATDVVEIMKYSMIDTYSDQYGFLDFSRSQHGSGMSTKSAAKKFVAVLQRQYDRNFNPLFTVQDMREIAQHAGIRVGDFEGFVSSLNNQGFLLKKGPRLYQLQTAGY